MNIPTLTTRPISNTTPEAARDDLRPYLIVWNDHTRDMLVHAELVDRPDAEQTLFVFWRDGEEVLMAPTEQIHHVRLLAAEEAKAHEAEEQACLDAHALMHDLVHVLHGNAAKPSDAESEPADTAVLDPTPAA